MDVMKSIAFVARARWSCALACVLAMASGCSQERAGGASAAASTAPPATSASRTGASTAPRATTSASTEGAAPAAPPTWDCGAKGQKPCPMQAWMKNVLAIAVATSDPDEMAAALGVLAAKTPPGFDRWEGIARDGATRAKAGDLDGAKASCKKCHDLYKEKYVTTMRDRAF